MRIWTLSLALAALVACAGGDDKATDTENTDDTTQDDTENGDDTEVGDDTESGDDTENGDDTEESETDTETTDEPSDPTEGLEASESCEDYDGNEIAGATRFYAGWFEVDGDGSVTGKEYLLYFTNSTWAEGEGEDCIIVWDATGTQDGSGSSFDLEMDMELDEGETTCIEGLWAGDETFSVTYGVEVDGDETTFAFSSGTEFGWGEANSDASILTYVSDGACAWF